jgi:hypothetical protein
MIKPATCAELNLIQKQPLSDIIAIIDKHNIEFNLTRFIALYLSPYKWFHIEDC